MLNVDEPGLRFSRPSRTLGLSFKSGGHFQASLTSSGPTSLCLKVRLLSIQWGGGFIESSEIREALAPQDYCLETLWVDSYSLDYFQSDVLPMTSFATFQKLKVFKNPDRLYFRSKIR